MNVKLPSLRGNFSTTSVILLFLLLAIGQRAQSQANAASQPLLSLVRMSASPTPPAVNLGNSVTISANWSALNGSIYQTNSAGCYIYLGSTQEANLNLGTGLSGGSAQWTPSSVGSYSGQCYWSGIVQYNGTKTQTNASANTTFTVGYLGFVNPKFVVLAVDYAPPGSNSYTQYGGTTSVGNTINLSNSFESGVSYSVSVARQSNLKLGSVLNGQATYTASSSTDVSQESNSSTTTTISKSSTVQYTNYGTPTFSPVNSDYDYIWLWLNPEVVVYYIPSVGSSPASIQWNGYAIDPNDPGGTQGPDKFPVEVGCLNGHFSCPSALQWLNGTEGPGSYVTSGTLARTWQSTAAGYQWPSGEVPGLTFNDVCQILNQDVLAVTPSQCPVQKDYTGFNGLPNTTPDGRFTQDLYPPNPIAYTVGALATAYNTVQTNTQSVAQGATTTITQTFSVETAFNGAFLSLFSGAVVVNRTQTLQWKSSWLDTLTTSTTISDGLSVTGPPNPPPVYNGPDQFIAYQDNLIGTFIFVPVE